MPEQMVAPYGSWNSPLTAEMIVQQSVGLGQSALDGEAVYWTESRPLEKGRTVLVRWTPDGSVSDITLPGHSVRTRVHEYGGGAFAVRDGVVWYCNDADQRVYCQRPGAAPLPVTPEGPWRYADLVADRAREPILAVREDHGRNTEEPVNELVAITGGGKVEVLASGADFYAAPRPAPDGAGLAWLSWDHPNMPWDGCTLTRAALDDKGFVAGAQVVAGGPREALFQPEWSPNGALHVVSDRSGWWNLYRCEGRRLVPLCPREAEFGLPQWVFNMRTYGFADDENLLCAFSQEGVAHLARVNTGRGTFEPIALPFVEIGGLTVDARHAVFVGGSADAPPALVRFDARTEEVTNLRRSAEQMVAPGYVSEARAVSFESAGGRRAHGFFYPPRNRDFRAPNGERPPLVVKSHGGPTGQSGCAFNLKTQFWTSRGIAVLDVNYGGSTGYGRTYRELLCGQWGVVDVEDCEAGARWLVQQGLVDPERLAISGGSAGGYTTLCALTFGDTFRAGASTYGIGDLEALARDTHKFESRYLDRLVGRWPEEKATYRARSPIHHVEGLGCPVIFFQGLEDKVVPPNQAEAMVTALREKGIPVAYLTFPGEAHGFRQAATIKRALEAELAFYGCVFDFTPADPIEPIEIENMA
jgi:dipeptidyl aminopeptidase/acylaminoacyl peptidase